MQEVIARECKETHNTSHVLRIFCKSHVNDFDYIFNSTYNTTFSWTFSKAFNNDVISHAFKRVKVKFMPNLVKVCTNIRVKGSLTFN